MNKLFGLVLCGGESSRMGEDKSLLRYHRKPQRYHLYDLLQSFCDRVFISCSKVQSVEVLGEYNLIVDEDKYSGIGPMAALLSAFEKFPDASFLVAGCDYPFIRKENIQHLTDARIGLETAVCYTHPETRISEPLFAIYEKEAHEFLLGNFRKKKYSLRHFLDEASTCMIIPDSFDFLQSVDDLQSYHSAKERLVAKLN